MDLSLSLIIPNYNNEKYLKECLQSVLNQTRLPDEVIIADDASTDNSQGIIKSYEKEHSFIRGVYRKDNLGVSENKHRAILQAKGNYITTLDSDDFYFSKTKLEEELDLIKEKYAQGNKKVIAYSDIIKVDRDGNKISTTFKDKGSEGNILLSVITRSKPIPRDFIMKKEHYLEVGGFNAELPIYEDWDLKIRLASKYSYYYTNNPGVAYRQHEKGLSSTSVRRHLYWQRRIFHDSSQGLPLGLYLLAFIRFNVRLSKKFMIIFLKRNETLLKLLHRIKKVAQNLKQC